MTRTTRSRTIISALFLMSIGIGSTAEIHGQSSEPNPARADSKITAAIQNQFLRDATLSPLAVEISTHDGIASLDGDVANLLETRLAAEVAEAVRGVRAVVNRIEVTPSNRSSSEIVEAVDRELRSNPATDFYEISATADNEGHVTLSGTVDSWAERNLAERVAMMARGVTGITNGIVTDTRKAHRNETEIRNDVEARLRWDTLVDDSLISVLAAQGGRVTLSGTVGSAAEKRRAGADAWVAGVRSVDTDHLEVEPWANDDDLRLDKFSHKKDSEVRAAIMKTLAYDPRVLDEEIAVTVTEGGARLLGEVKNLQAKQAAGQDARNTVGVVAVRNELDVVPGPINDTELEQLVSNALTGAGLLEDNSISVSVENGVVSLEGEVSSTPDYWHAERIAGNARGAVDVRNDLTVNGEARIRTAYAYGFYPNIHYGQPELADGPLPTDREIHANVESELFWSPFVDEDAISISVDDGVVTLAGAVASLREKEIARENALEGGAIRVNNDLAVDN